MSLNVDEPDRAGTGVTSFETPITKEMKEVVGSNDATPRKTEAKKPDFVQRVNAKRKASEFKVFEPMSRRFVDETQAGAFLRPTTTPLLNKEHQDEPESKFPKFLFLNSHASQPYTPVSRPAARAHVMRRVFIEKDARKVANDHHCQNISNTVLVADPNTEPIKRRLLERATTSPSGSYDDSHNLAFAEQQASGAPPKPLAESHNSPEPLLDPEIPWRPSSSPLCTNILDFSTQRRDVELIHHYIQVFAKSSLPMSSLEESQYFKKALNDQACYHGTLFVSAAHRALLAGTGRELSRDCYRHKGEAIKTINQRLSDPHQRIEDGTIAAIACLTAYENVNGSLEIAAAHVNGLEIIGKLRGGFHSSDMPGFLEKLVYWVELCNASALKQRARFVPQNLLSLMTPGLVAPDSDAFAVMWDRHWGVLAPQIGFRLYEGLTMREATIFHRIRQLSFIRSMVQSIRELDTDTQQRFTNNVLLIERQINVIVNGIGASGKVLSLPKRCMPFYSATLLFVYLVLREVSIPSAILDNFIVRLRTTLGILKPQIIWREFPSGFLLWILFIGGWAAEGRPDRRWYSACLAWLSAQMELEFWEQAKMVLTEYAFVDFLGEGPCRRLWDESRQLDFRSGMDEL